MTRVEACNWNCNFIYNCNNIVALMGPYANEWMEINELQFYAMKLFYAVLLSTKSETEIFYILLNINLFMGNSGDQMDLLISSY